MNITPAYLCAPHWQVCHQTGDDIEWTISIRQIWQTSKRRLSRWSSPGTFSLRRPRSPGTPGRGNDESQLLPASQPAPSSAPASEESQRKKQTGSRQVQLPFRMCALLPLRRLSIPRAKIPRRSSPPKPKLKLAVESTPAKPTKPPTPPASTTASRQTTATADRCETDWADQPAQIYRLWAQQVLRWRVKRATADRLPGGQFFHQEPWIEVPVPEGRPLRTTTAWESSDPTSQTTRQTRRDPEYWTLCLLRQAWTTTSVDLTEGAHQQIPRGKLAELHWQCQRCWRASSRTWSCFSRPTSLPRRWNERSQRSSVESRSTMTSALKESTNHCELVLFCFTPGPFQGPASWTGLWLDTFCSRN